MAIFNGRNYTLADFLPFNYTKIWDQFWTDVLAELGLRAVAVGQSLVATSSTNSVSIGTGTKTLVIDSPSTKGFSTNMYVALTDAANAANAMTGLVVSYNAGTGALVVSVPSGGASGSGTPSSWKIGISGQTGPSGGVNTFNGRSGTVVPVAGDYTPSFIGALAKTGDTATGAIRGTVSTLTDAATITPDFSLANYFTLTIGGNRTLANPTNLVAGQGGSIFIIQDGTGNRTLSLGSYFKFANGVIPPLSTAAGTVDRLDYLVRTSTNIHASLVKGVP